MLHKCTHVCVFQYAFFKLRTWRILIMSTFQWPTKQSAVMQQKRKVK
jgi:hypothetical protein